MSTTSAKCIGVICAFLYLIHTPVIAIPVTYDVVPDRRWGETATVYKATTSGTTEDLIGTVPSGVNTLGVCSTTGGKENTGCKHFSGLGEPYLVTVVPGEPARDAVERFYKKNGYPATTETLVGSGSFEAECVGLMFGNRVYPVMAVPGTICSVAPPLDNKCSLSVEHLTFSFRGATHALDGLEQSDMIDVQCDKPTKIRIRAASEIRLTSTLSAGLRTDAGDLVSGVTMSVGERPLRFPLIATLKGDTPGGVYEGSTIVFVDLL